jgi:hypothetical protein
MYRDTIFKAHSQNREKVLLYIRSGRAHV